MIITYLLISLYTTYNDFLRKHTFFGNKSLTCSFGNENDWILILKDYYYICNLPMQEYIFNVSDINTYIALT